MANSWKQKALFLVPLLLLVIAVSALAVGDLFDVVPALTEEAKKYV